jgi:hypothetical protein
LDGYIADTVDLVEAASAVGGSEQFTTPLGISLFGAIQAGILSSRNGTASRITAVPS